MEIRNNEQELFNNTAINTTPMATIGTQIRNMPIPSPPSLSSSSEDDSDDISDEEEEHAALQNDLTSRLLLAEDDLHHDLSNLTLVGPETQARLEALLEAAGVAADGKAFTDPEVLRRLTSSVSSALDEAAAALTRMRSQPGNGTANQVHEQGTRSLVEACIEGDIAAVRKLLDEGRSVHEPTEEGESLLSLACSAGYYELVQVLLAMAANVEDRGSKGDCTPLMEAASGGYVDIVQLLLQNGANVNAQSSSGNTALHYACCSGYDGVVHVLIKHNADLEHQNENGHTPLMEAASGGHVKVAKLLLDNNAGINTHSSEFKESALTLACYKGHVDMVFFLLQRGADQEHKTDEMHTALMEASMDGHVEVAKLLLDHGAQVNMPADSFESPLTLAACGSHVELAQLLLEHGAKLEEVNDEGYTPLMEAAREGYLPMVALLLEHGANINAQTEETQETALTLACCGGFQEVVSYLLECGANIELGASTPLMEAATEGHVELVKFLLEKGANVNATTATGDAALTYAAENGHTDLVEVLIEAGANIEHESEGGRTPLMKAARAGHLCTVEYLISQGANINKKTTGDEHSVLSLACAGGHAAVVELLLTRGGNPTLQLKDNSSMLIEAAKGGHANVACLLIDAQIHHQSYLPPDSPIHAGFPSPVTSTGTVSHSSYHMCQHMQPTEHLHHMQPQHDCQFQCPHVQMQPAIQQLPQQICLSHNCTFTPPVIQPSALPPDDYQNMQSSMFDEDNFQHDIDVETSPTDLYVQNLPVSLATQLSLANLTPADLQSLAQALSFSSSVNTAIQHEQFTTSQAGVTEDLGIGANITFPVVDPQVESFTTQSEVCTPSPSDTTTALVTSAGRTITSTGVQTDAISMIQKLTNSVHQLNALQNFAAAHNLELVNLGEITLPPAPFSLDSEPEDGIMVAESAQTLEDSMAGITREEPIGECSPPPLMEATLSAPSQSPVSTPLPAVVDIDQATESNHDTALTIACAGGHDDLVKLLLARGSNIEHRDKKGCTPLILAATAGHTSTCHILLDYGADIEAQSDRTKDTALSLACSSGRQEVVELLLMSNANCEHRNVSDYTPLSLAASGGYVGIIKVLLNHGAEINSRTGSKLGISPLMLAAMNGHVAAVKLLLDRGSDVNAQIETNRNTALTLACFQGRTEVVGLLLDRCANVEHRAKTGLTPLMEAASGGYVEVGRVLIDRGADVVAQPVPSSRDTALTIAADKGHYKFVELLVLVGATIDVRNKKGCTPLWLACNGGHLDVCQLLARDYADVNATDNRGVSCLMAAFRKGNVKVVKWLVKHVSQFPPDSDCKRFMQTVSDKDLLKKLEECMHIIIAAKKRQEAEANKNASILLEELDYEKKKEEKRKAAAQKKRDKKKQKKKKKTNGKQCNGELDHEEADEKEEDEDEDEAAYDRVNFSFGDEAAPIIMNDERPDLSTAELKLKSQKQLKKKEKKSRLKSRNASLEKNSKEEEKKERHLNHTMDSLTNIVITTAAQVVSSISPLDTVSASTAAEITKAVASSIMTNAKKTDMNLKIDAEVAATMVTAVAQCAVVSLTTSSVIQNNVGNRLISPKKSRRAEDGWKEVTRNAPQSRVKKILIPASLISRVIGRGGCNVNAIREHTSAHIDIDTNRKKANGDCMVTIKGSQQATRQAAQLVQSLIDNPERDVTEILPPNVNGRPSVKLEVPNPIGNSPAGLSKSLNNPKQHSRTSLTQRQMSAPAAVSQHQETDHDFVTCKIESSSSVHAETISTSNNLNVANGQSKSTSSWNVKSKSQSLTESSLNRMTPDNLTHVSTTVISTVTTSVSRISGPKSPAARKLFVANASGSTTPSKSFPMPIGSNRPARYLNQQNTVSSTNVSESITASLHTTLTNLLSQVATQRSPMIWNDRNGAKDTTSVAGDVVVTTLATSPSNLSSGIPPDRHMPRTMSQNSSQDSSFKGHSRTPSLSPTSNHSVSPTPEERPHLNPIGSERGLKRPMPTRTSNLPGLTPLLPGSERSAQNLWHFDYNIQKSATWISSDHSALGWVNEQPNDVQQHPNRINGDIDNDHFSVGPDETLKSLLERLSLSNHLNLFQKNEIDLDALMLMTEQDYADIGLPKEPRVKLLNSMNRLRPETNGVAPQDLNEHYRNHQPHLLKHPQAPHMWNSAPPQPSMDPNLNRNISQQDTPLPPGLHGGIPFHQAPQLVNSWQPWSNTVDQ